MQNATTIVKNLHQKINNLLVEKNKHELKSTQLRGVLNTIMGLVESAITHEELQGEVVRDISKLLDRRYDLINEEIQWQGRLIKCRMLIIKYLRLV